mgnify:CR=1 FL=1
MSQEITKDLRKISQEDRVRIIKSIENAVFSLCQKRFVNKGLQITNNFFIFVG